MDLFQTYFIKFENPSSSTTTNDPFFSDKNVSSLDKKTSSFDHRRSKFSSSQLQLLQKAYEKSKYITYNEKKELSQLSRLTMQQIKDWFQNRRKREKNKNKRKEDFEKKWNDYLMDLVKIIRVDSVADMMKYMDMGAITDFVCPHEYFHNTNQNCPCAYKSEESEHV